MRQPEQQFWNLLKKHLPGEVSRVENICESGMPDVNGTWRGLDYWIELKVCDNKNKLRPVKSLLRTEQSVWITRRMRHGCRVYVFVRYPDKIAMYHAIGSTFDMMGVYAKERNSFDWGSIELNLTDDILYRKLWSK